jgi:hypothetical protein
MNDAIDAESRVIGSEIVPVKVATPVAPIPRYFQDISPADQVQYAVDVANALKPIIDSKGLAHKLNKKNPNDEYVELEAWQTCGKLCGMSAKVEWVKPIDKGFEARAVVIRVDTGLEIGAGESRCTRDEYNWKGRDDYAVSGMAQTRSQSRALRGQLAWILVLAGYKPTPSEEMPADPPPPAAPPADKRRDKLIKDIHVLCQSRGVSRPLYLSTLSELYPERYEDGREPTSKRLSTEELQNVYQVLSERTAASG